MSGRLAPAMRAAAPYGVVRRSPVCARDAPTSVCAIGSIAVQASRHHRRSRCEAQTMGGRCEENRRRTFRHSAFALSGCSRPGSEDATYDIVLAGGRVMDPESDLDAIRNVGVLDGLIAAVTEDALDGTRVIDANGLVVAPGFIDLHVHGQTDYSFTFMIRDGVTSGFELEVGTGDVEGWYRDREGWTTRQLWRERRPHPDSHHRDERPWRLPSQPGPRRTSPRATSRSKR